MRTRQKNKLIYTCNKSLTFYFSYLKKLIILILIIQSQVQAQSSALQIADSLYTDGNYSKAIESYKKHNNLTEVYSKIAKAYIAIGNYDLALENYKNAMESNLDKPRIKYEYAKLLITRKKYKKASNLFEELILHDFQNPNYQYQQGLALEKLKDDTAINRFITTYDLDQTHQKAIFKIARHYLVKRKHQISLKYIDKGLESYKFNTALISLKAQNYYLLDDYNNAIIWFKKLLELGENSEFIQEKLSICYAQNSNYTKAIYHRKEALKFNPRDAQAIYVLGSYYDKNTEFTLAEKHYSEALRLLDKPLNAEYVVLGKVLNRQKKYKEAVKVFNKALKETPNDVFIKLLILRTKDEYYADRKAVIKLYEIFVEKHKKNPVVRIAEMRLKELKEENFMSQN